jgi:hypothetical protein
VRLQSAVAVVVAVLVAGAGTVGVLRGRMPIMRPKCRNPLF